MKSIGKYRNIGALMLIACGTITTSIVSAATEGNGQHQYLVLKDERHFYFYDVLGLIPMFDAEKLLLGKTQAQIDEQLDKFTNGRMVTPDTIGADKIPGWDEAMGLFDLFRVSTGRHLEPDDESDFFESHHPDFSIGPVLAGIRANGTAVDRGLTFRFFQVLVDKKKAYDLPISAPDRYWKMELCVFDLEKGTLLHCAYGGEDEFLFDRLNIFRSAVFTAELEAVFNDPARRVHVGGPQ